MSRYVDVSPYEKCRIVLHSEDDGFQVSKLPTVDAVEVVRCKGCKYFEQIPSGMFRGNYCTNTFWNCEESIEVEPNDFCSYGERRNDV